MDKIQIMKFSDVPINMEFKFVKSDYYKDDEYVMNHVWKKLKKLNYSIILYEINNPSIQMSPPLSSYNDLCEVYVFECKIKEYNFYAEQVKQLNEQLSFYTKTMNELKKQLKENFNHDI